jgi:intein/homing endonuclease
MAGVRILRFKNERVFADLEKVINEIAEHISASPPASTREKTIWVVAENLEIGSEVIVDESGATTVISAVENRFVDEVVYDLTVEEDHSFVTEAGIAHNCGDTTPPDL